MNTHNPLLANKHLQDPSVVDNYNPIYNTNFKLEFAQARHINFFLQSCSLPSITLDEVSTPHHNYEVWVPSETIKTTALDVKFLVSENYDNYLWVVQWMYELRDTNNPLNLLKDINLHLLSNNKSSNILVALTYAFPTSVSELTLESAQSDVEPITCDATFRFQEIYFERQVEV